jgi:NAD(P)H-nitrite reductase large subunit
MRYVIIGGSIAGISAVKEIRTSDVKGEIMVISAERTKGYYRPMIPSLIEKDGIDITFADDPLEKYATDLIFGTAKGLDASSREVLLTSGKKVRYDKLLIATGSGPLIPRIEGLRGDDAFPLRTMEDALRIKASAKNKKRAVVIGGGFVGTKASIALQNLGLSVTIVEERGQILPQRLDRRGARIIADAMKKQGIEIITDDTVSEIIRSSGKVRSLRLSSGSILDADIVVIAAGARPNVEAFRDSGIRINKGIIIGESLGTNVPDVYAAGDVAEHVDLITGAPAVSALWANAEEMGRFAGRNMAGGTVKYGGFLSVMNATEILGVPVISVGLIEPEPVGGGYEVIVDDTLDSYRKLVFRGDVLVGVIFVGEISNAGIYTNLIKNSIPIGALKDEAINGSLSYADFVNTVPTQMLSA